MIRCGVLARLALLALGVVVLPASLVLATQRAADSLGRAIGRDAAQAVALLPPFAAASKPPLLPPAPAETEPLAAAEPAAPATRARRGRTRPAPAKGAQGVFVSADAVLALAARGIAPRGVPVAASGPRPAGLRLVGVSALGVGLRDGDVLTSVLGAPATSVASVVDAIIRARARNAAVISGEFWRDGRALPLAVAQPYAAPAAPVASTPRSP